MGLNVKEDSNLSPLLTQKEEENAEPCPCYMSN